MVGDIIKLEEPRSEGLAEPLHHASDAGNVVVGGTDEGEETLDGILLQESHTWGPERQRDQKSPVIGSGLFSPSDSRYQGSGVSQGNEGQHC